MILETEDFFLLKISSVCFNQSLTDIETISVKCMICLSINCKYVLDVPMVEEMTRVFFVFVFVCFFCVCF